MQQDAYFRINHRFTEQFRLEWTSRCFLDHPSAQSRTNLEQVAQNLVQLSSDYLPKERICNLSGKTSLCTYRKHLPPSSLYVSVR